jgi:hypothetical protein
MMDSFENSTVFADGSDWQQEEQPEHNSPGTADKEAEERKDYFHIVISDARKMGEGSAAYISYSVTVFLYLIDI